MSYDKAKTIADGIVERFKAGNLPDAIAPIFLACGGRHADAYSWTNQMLVALAGYSDARGFNQWKEVGRQVRGGQKGLFILKPYGRKEKRTDPATGKEVESFRLCGFGTVCVFGLEQTDVFDAELWEKHRPDNSETRKFLDELPLRDVAEKWGLSLQAYNGRSSAALGWYRHGEAIALGVANLSTWAHELCHAADDRNGKLKGDKKNTEIVAELGGAVLLTVCGYTHDADLGGAWKYITAYAGDNPIAGCMAMLNRVCEAVALILQTAGLREPPTKKQAESETAQPALATVTAD